MKLEEIKCLLGLQAAALQEDLGIARLAVFGSVARGEASAGSDVDILVEFIGRADFDRYMTLKERLESLLGTRVDLVTTKAIRPELRPRIEQEAVRVA